jgi:protein-tyrosine-phosphatase
MKKVLFVCVHNSGRSQMAEAFFNKLSRGRASATSAGTRPASQIDPTVIEAMLEVNIDISKQMPKQLTIEIMEKADLVITMGCNVEETCPAGFMPTVDWNLNDPQGKALEEVRQIRDEIRTKVEELIRQIQQI